VLWSIVQGERLEFPIVLDFLSNAALGFTFEAVIIEAENTGVIDPEDPDAKPSTVQPSGVESALNVRVPTYRDVWVAGNAYTREEFVLHNTLYYKRRTGTGIIDATPPNTSADWIEFNPATVYLQFESSLSTTWAVQPKPGIPTHGFFELRVTEPNTVFFQRTWKPMRGMIEFLFSPTEVVV
jgi:hypothetical protein